MASDRTHEVEPLTPEQWRKNVIDSCRLELATNFEAPAIKILAWHGQRIGLTSEQMQTLIDKET